jgi:hypothetical protein
VVVQDSINAVRGNWTTSRVVNVFPGKDGKIRNLKVRTATSYYERPITKIAVIYPAEGHGDKEGYGMRSRYPHRGGRVDR